MEWTQWIAMVSAVAGVTPESLLPESRLREDLGMDSLQLVNLLLMAAQTASVDASRLTSLDQVKTLEQLYSLVQGDWDERG